MASNLDDKTTHHNNLEINPFDFDSLMDIDSLLNCDTWTIKNTDYQSYFGIDPYEDIDDWLSSIVPLTEREMDLFPDPKMAEPVVHHKTERLQPNNTQRRNDDELFRVPKIYKCPFCSKQFYSKTSHCKHGTLHAKRLLRCEYCQYRTRNLDALRRHHAYYHIYVRRRIHVPSF